MAKLMRAVTIGLAVVALGGCFVALTGPELALQFVIDGSAYSHEASFDFGDVDVDAGPVTVSGTLTNISMVDFTVGSVVLSGEDPGGSFAISVPEAPFEVASGDTVAASLRFDPIQSGLAVAVLSATIEGVTEPFILNLSGTGNTAPVARVPVQISGAGTSAVNGTYYRTEELENTYPVYRLEGTDYRLYGWDGDGVAWVLDDDFDPGTTIYDHYSNTYSAPNGAPSDWSPGSGATPDPTSEGEIISSNGGVYEIPDGAVVSPSYEYFDAEDDPEGATTYQWYRAEVDYDPLGTYSAIPGAIGSTYTVTPSDHRRSLKVLVTPAAASGTPVGEPVWFGPSPAVWAPVFLE